MKKLFIVIFCFLCLQSFAQTGSNTPWTWVNGDSTTNHIGIYGIEGVADPLNSPGARSYGTSWKDANGNLWMFGGSNFGTSLEYKNDLWKYDIASNEWTWVSGSSSVNLNGIYGTKGVAASTNLPGSRSTATSWIDDNGNLWLFGGLGYAETGSVIELNDLWKFDVLTGEWTWVKGDKTYAPLSVYGTQGISSSLNKPGGRIASSAWKDNNGNFWLFGGFTSGSIGFLNELWKYDPVDSEWTWVRDNTSDQNGVYGTQTVPGILNKPGTRELGKTWVDNNGNLWMFGGYGYSINSGNEEELNDLWKYNIATNQWAWMKGDTIGNQHGIYGIQGTSGILNKPGGRDGTSNWKDADGNFWFFGGGGAGAAAFGELNDIWKYDLNNNEWTWIKGDSTVNHNGIYGSLGVSSFANRPGSRNAVISWTDNLYNFWIFGGQGYAQSGTASGLNDLWKINSNSLIPLTLLSFNGTAINNENVLYWQTAQEINISRFIIERSTDGSNFIAIGNRVAAGNSSGTRDYNFTDKQPLPLINFYRLKMLDIDGKFTYSITIVIKRNANSAGMIVFPNPVKDILFVQLTAQKGNGIIQVLDVTGKKIKESSMELNENSSFSIPVGDLAKGTYLLLIKTSFKTFQQKFIKE